MEISFTKTGKLDFDYWSENNQITSEKVKGLILDIVENGALLGKGKPEKLKYLKLKSKHTLYSRRINNKDRLVYCIVDDELIIVSCKGHYEK